MIPIRDTVPLRRTPIVTWLLILANVGAFVYELGLSPRNLDRLVHLYGLVPARYTDVQAAALLDRFNSPVVPFVSSMFLHGGWLHLLSNLLSLWIFGDNVEDRMGRLRYLLFYLLCGVLAGMVHVSTNLESAAPTVGASGAIAGIMGAYFLLFPRSQVVMLVPIFCFPLFFQVPAVVFLFLWFLSQVFQGTLSLGQESMGAGIAWWAHVGGFVAGMLLLGLFGVKRERARRVEPPAF